MRRLIAVGISCIGLCGPAWANNICLTKAEARKLWPKQHIYWYSKDHCWSNRRGPPSGIKKERIDKNEPIYNEAPRSYLYPLDSNGNIDTTFEDHCCWPSLDDLKALANGVEK